MYIFLYVIIQHKSGYKDKKCLVVAETQAQAETIVRENWEAFGNHLDSLRLQDSWKADKADVLFYL